VPIPGQFHLSGDLKLDGDTISFGSTKIFFDAETDLIGMKDGLSVAGKITADEITGTFIEGTSSVTGYNLFSNQGVFLNHDGPDGDAYILFYEDGSNIGESLKWNNAKDRFEFSDRLRILDNIIVGTAGNVAYNAMGGYDPSSGWITYRGDLFVDDDVEIEGKLSLSKRLYMEGATSSGKDGDQTIYFYEGGSRIGEYFRWDDSKHAFAISDALHYSGGGDFEIRNRGGRDLELFAPDDYEIMIDRNSGGSVNWWRLYHDGSFTSSKRLAEFRESGNLRIRGSLTQHYGFDVAESFLQAEPVEPGDVVRVDPGRGDALRLASAGDGGAVIGAVSEAPGVVLGGPGFGPEDLEAIWGFEVRQQFDQERGALASEVIDRYPELEESLVAAGKLEGAGLERLLAAERADLAPEVRSALEKVDSLMMEIFAERRLAPVALAGRTAVKVDASHGAIEIGDYLTVGPTPGVAVKATGPGPVIGTALESFAEGQGKVLTLIDRGWYGGGASGELWDMNGGEAADGAESGVHAAPADGPQIVLGPSTGTAELTVVRQGATGPGEELLRLDRAGNLQLKGSIRTTAHALAEYHPVTEPVELGDLVVVDRGLPGALRPGAVQADPAVVGFVAGRPGIVLGSRISDVAEIVPELATALDEARAAGDLAAERRIWSEMRRSFEVVHAPIAMSGTVLAKVDAGYGAVGVGDLLAASPTRGHAMRSDDAAPGTIVGKALEPLEAGRGLIQVLVMLR
jgi:hypothetical protein